MTELNIRVGGKYRTRGGQEAEVTKRPFTSGLWPFSGAVGGLECSWTETGLYWRDGSADSRDLVSEIAEPTPSELVRSGSPNVVGDDFFAMSVEGETKPVATHRHKKRGTEYVLIGYMSGEAKGKERIAEAETQAKKYEGLAEEAAECLLEWMNRVKAKASEIEALADENRRLRENPGKPWTSEELSALQDLLTKTAGRLAAAEADAERLAEALQATSKALEALWRTGATTYIDEIGSAKAALSAHEARKERS